MNKENCPGIEEKCMLNSLPKKKYYRHIQIHAQNIYVYTLLTYTLKR